jgi:ligand-binding SRPBCC domain-containing protein
VTGPTVARTTTVVHAPIELVFDLARDVDEHVAALAHTAERAVPPGRRHGRLERGDVVCFQARHFGLRWRLHARIVEMERPHRFVDVQVRGPFRSLRHEHVFTATGAGTLVTDTLTLTSPAGPLRPVVDGLILRRHLLRVLQVRNAHLKRRAEVTAARNRLGGVSPN